jgi:hypothetical protein
MYLRMPHARRSARLEEPVPAGWIDIPLDSLADLVASKIAALIERGAPHDFLAIQTHLERIELHRPLEQIENPQERDQAQKLRGWFLNEFRQVSDE